MWAEVGACRCKLQALVNEGVNGASDNLLRECSWVVEPSCSAPSPWCNWLLWH